MAAKPFTPRPQAPAQSTPGLSRAAGATHDGVLASPALYHLLWHDREVVALGGGHYRVRVPVIGPPPSSGLAARFETQLALLWIGHRHMSGIVVTSVVADVRAWHGATHLTVVIGTRGEPTRRIDGTSMARDLRLALQQTALEDALH